MSVYTNIMLPAANFLRDVEMVGLIYDTNAAADAFENDVNPELQMLRKDMRDISGVALLNPNAHAQMAAIYYDMWGIEHEMRHRPPQQGRTFERSTDDSARRVILEESFECKATVDRGTVDSFVRKHHRYAKLNKLNSQYIVGLIPYALEDHESRIYTNINLHTTETGRTSSTDPNLQNIARPRPFLPDIRNLFVAPPGRQMVQADYSQAELRVIAYLSQDPELLRIYLEGLDLHSQVATMFHGEGYTPEQRSKCKNMNFGVAYRQSAKSFKEKHDIPTKEAQKFIDWWWGRFSGVTRWELGIEKEVHANAVTTPFGRRRRFYLITDQNKQAAYREGINQYPQSIASDFTLLAGIKIHNEIDRERAALNLMVHDSLMAEVDDAYVDEYEVICKQVMESIPKDTLGWDIPFVSDIGHGTAWGSAK